MSEPSPMALCKQWPATERTAAREADVKFCLSSAAAKRLKFFRSCEGGRLPTWQGMVNDAPVDHKRWDGLAVVLHTNCTSELVTQATGIRAFCHDDSPQHKARRKFLKEAEGRHGDSLVLYEGATVDNHRLFRRNLNGDPRAGAT
jgi:hypothetical protein